MGGSSVLAIDDWEFANLSNEVKTLVLFGRTGNGKSATGNSILGKKVFKSRASSSGITVSCEMQTTTMNDGQIVNVIDTPGLFDFSVGSELIGKEIFKSINLAKNGIDAIIVVFSVRTRFSEEENRALRRAFKFFGSKIVDYMIVVFTGGDELEENDQTLDDYLGSECPEPLKAILSLCGNRCVLFDNKTKDEKKQFEQVQRLLSLVDMVISQNDGKPYTETDESKLREATIRLEQQLAIEQTARLNAENNAYAAQMISNDKEQQLRKRLEMAHSELRMGGQDNDRCAIL